MVDCCQWHRNTPQNNDKSVCFCLWVLLPSNSNINSNNIVNRRLCCVSFRHCDVHAAKRVSLRRGRWTDAVTELHNIWWKHKPLVAASNARCRFLVCCSVSEGGWLVRVDWGRKKNRGEIIWIIKRIIIIIIIRIIRTFWPSVKSTEEWAKDLSRFYELGSGPNL